METDRKSVRVTTRATQQAAMAEASRRLQVMHSKWPQTPWRMRIKRERHRTVSRWQVWAIYCEYP